MIDTVQELVEVEENMSGREIHNTKTTVMISLHIPILWNKTLKKLVRRGRFINRSDAIRHMIDNYFESHDIEVKER